MPYTAETETATPPSRMPWYFLLATLLIAVLRGLPYLVARYDQPVDPNVGFLPIGYNPPDFSAYLAFIRQGFSLGLVNPYTVDPQDGRFILLYHQTLGLIRSLTGLESFTLLELSRIPLLFFFTWAAWRFIQVVHRDSRRQIWTMWLVLFSGGVEYLLSFTSYLPISLPSLNENFTLLGLNTFQTFYNPLWTGAMGLYLVILRPILNPEDEIQPATQVLIFIGFLVLHLSHPYTSIMLLAVWLGRPALALMLKLDFDWKRQFRVGVALIPAIAVCGSISLWQTRDVVYRMSASNTFGVTSVSIFLYPAILGAVGVAALRGWRYWITEHHPWALSVGAWTLMAIFLHSSPILNGYHYIPYLHFPLCLVAVGPFLHGLDRLKSRSVMMRDLAILFYCTIFFFSPLATTNQSILAIYKTSARSKDTFQALDWLKGRPAGNVLCSGRFGLLVPVYTDHRVFVGHWFLSPEYREKDELFYKLVATANIKPDDLLRQLYIHKIDYFIVPTLASNSVVNALGELVSDRVNIGEMTIITLKKK